MSPSDNPLLHVTSERPMDGGSAPLVRHRVLLPVYRRFSSHSLETLVTFTQEYMKLILLPFCFTDLYINLKRYN